MNNANASRFKMSQERLDALKEELYYLETVREKEVSELIKEARSFGEAKIRISFKGRGGEAKTWDFNIVVGTREDEIGDLVRKSGMKRVFIEAGIPTARQHIVSDLAAGQAFVKKVGYPVIVKPDIGVGANGAMKVNNEEDLLSFYGDLPSEPYVMEEFLSGDICTYDAILGADCEPLFESMCSYPPVIDAVQNDDEIHFYTIAEVPEQLREFGRKAAKAFGADRRFVHFEFINITKDYEGIGKAGDYAIMEVNMRPAGGHDPDMMNYAQSIDVFDIYAQMVTAGRADLPETAEHYICAYAARRDGGSYTHTPEEIAERYGSAIVMQEEMPPIDWPSMGRYVYMAKFREKEEMDRYFAFVLE